MNHAEQIAKRHELFALIKKYGLHYKEDIEFLREYAKDVVANYDLDEALLCFRDLNEQIKYYY